VQLPKIKKGISDFLTGEEGNISKKAIVGVAVVLVVLAKVMKSVRANSGICGGTCP
jgi:hypothetical protein